MTKSKNKVVGAIKEPETALLELIKKAAYSKTTDQVFRDFVEISAISIANSVTLGCVDTSYVMSFRLLSKHRILTAAKNEQVFLA